MIRSAIAPKLDECGGSRREMADGTQEYSERVADRVAVQKPAAGSPSPIYRSGSRAFGGR